MKINKNISNIKKFFDNLASNKLFLGLMMIFMNIGSRFVEIKFTKGQEMILKNIAREVMIFVIAFMGSRDFLTALLITTCFIILSQFIFNENSNYNLIPKKYKDLMKQIDTNNDGVISKKELDDALKTISKAKDNLKD